MGGGAALSFATVVGIDILVYSQAAPGAAEAENPSLDEEHWSYMDGFAAGMVARGPTLAPDRTTWTGSLHVLDLPSAAVAEEFVAREPYNRAGLFRSHTVRRFENLLGRTMWDFDGHWRSALPRACSPAGRLTDAGSGAGLPAARARSPDPPRRPLHP